MNMENTVYDLNLLNVCRACSAHCVLTDMISIESLKCSSEMISVLIFLDIQVIEDLSNAICSNCVLQLDNILNLKTKCAMTLKILRNTITKSHPGRVYVKTENLEASDYSYNDEPNEKIQKLTEADSKPSIEMIQDKNLSRNIYIQKINQNNEREGTNLKLNKNSDSPKKELDVEGISIENIEKKNQNEKMGICWEKFEEIKSVRRRCRIAHKSNDNLFTYISCPSCPRKYYNKKNFEKHSKTHDEVVCNICNREFNSNLYLQRHKKRHSTKQLACTACSKIFLTRDVNVNICKTCNKQVKFKENIQSQQEHFKNINADYFISEQESEIDDRGKNNELKTEEWSSQLDSTIENKLESTNEIQIQNETHSIHQCTICSKKFKTSKSVKFHIHIAHKENADQFTWYSCPYCPRKYYKIEHLENHKKLHDNVVCDICNKKFLTSRRLNRHRKIHEMSKSTLFCTECNKNYTNFDSLIQHNRVFHGTNLIVCTVCNKSIYNLSYHMRIEHPVVSPKCKFCQKTFKNASSLLNHIKVQHEGRYTESQLCQICGKEYRNLKLHNQMVHLNERKYKCQYCEKTYKTSGHKLIHERVEHLKELNYKCEYCARGFATKQLLKRHIRTHTLEKPYVCDICSRPFSQTSSLKTHVKLIHGTKLE